MPSGSSQTLPRITPDKEVLFGCQHNHPNRALPILNVFRPGGQGRRGFRPGSESAPEKGSRAAICLACRSCKNIRVSLFTPGPRPPIIAASITSGRWICWTISVIWSVDLGTQSLQNGGLDVFGGVPKRSTGADCKSAGFAFGGSNPPPSTTENRFFEFLLGLLLTWRIGNWSEIQADWLQLRPKAMRV